MASRSSSGVGSVTVLLILFSAPGFAGGGVVRLQSADVACPGFSAEEIYHPCDNGTVTDNRTKLVWLADANCLHGLVDWYTAMEFVSGLAPPACGLYDNSQPGDWRLPTTDEWRQMTENANGDPGDLDCDPAISNDFDNSCWTAVCYGVDLCSFKFVASGLYWAANPVRETGIPAGIAWVMALDEGQLSSAAKFSKVAYVWPVRTSQ